VRAVITASQMIFWVLQTIIVPRTNLLPLWCMGSSAFGIVWLARRILILKGLPFSVFSFGYLKYAQTTPHFLKLYLIFCFCAF
jgi:hypothetical protein